MAGVINRKALKQIQGRGGGEAILKWRTPRESAGDGTDYGLNVIHGKRTIGALPVNWDNFLLY